MRIRPETEAYEAIDRVPLFIMRQQGVLTVAGEKSDESVRCMPEASAP